MTLHEFQTKNPAFPSFKFLFPPPPPTAKTKSSKHRNTPRKATTKKRQLQSISVVDDTDPIKDTDSDKDWQLFWSSSKKGVTEATRSLGPMLLHVFREEGRKGDSLNTETKTATPVLQQPNAVIALPISGPSSALLSIPPTIPLDEQVVSYALRLTSIKDLTSNNPQRRYHVLGLIQRVAPVRVVPGFQGKRLPGLDTPDDEIQMLMNACSREIRDKGIRRPINSAPAVDNPEPGHEAKRKTIIVSVCRVAVQATGTISPGGQEIKHEAKNLLIDKTIKCNKCNVLMYDVQDPIDEVSDGEEQEATDRFNKDDYNNETKRRRLSMALNMTKSALSLA
ncbi:MAG: hypothetical protein J3R72DRAFT_529076 [Linnemannia gamsii]|nr:MAG: hypothetical protein J3R72DRAFT_529076 [Linnemannia gamsii]